MNKDKLVQMSHKFRSEAIQPEIKLVDQMTAHKPNLQSFHFNYEASNVEACRICLATNVKMYRLNDTRLGGCMESVFGFDKSNEGLPDYVCYECAACLMKCKKLVEKSMTAQATLRDIFIKNGQIHKYLIEEENRVDLNLKSSLDYSDQINIHIEDNSNLNTSNYTKVETDLEEPYNRTDYITIKNEIKQEQSFEGIDISEDLNADNTKLAMCYDKDVQWIKVEIPLEKDPLVDGSSHLINWKPLELKKDRCAIKLITHKHDKLVSDLPNTIGINEMRKSKSKQNRSKMKEMVKNMHLHNFEESSEETYIQKYFNVEVLPVQETNSTIYSCKFCPKSYSNIDEANNHRLAGCSVSQGGSTSSIATSSTGPGHSFSQVDSNILLERLGWQQNMKRFVTPSEMRATNS